MKFVVLFYLTSKVGYRGRELHFTGELEPAERAYGD
jgi:hypothetical protein